METIKVVATIVSISQEDNTITSRTRKTVTLLILVVLFRIIIHNPNISPTHHSPNHISQIHPKIWTCLHPYPCSKECLNRLHNNSQPHKTCTLTLYHNSSRILSTQSVQSTMIKDNFNSPLSQTFLPILTLSMLVMIQPIHSLSKVYNQSYFQCHWIHPPMSSN